MRALAHDPVTATIYAVGHTDSTDLALGNCYGHRLVQASDT